MSRTKGITGERFGRLVVVGQKGRASDRHILWECRCDCGGTTVVSGRDLRRGHTQSCGCLQKERTHTARFKHGDKGTRLYLVWQTMKRRCENKNRKDYKWYGAKGVSVCNEWQDYSTFKEWAISHGYDESAKRGDCTIDRIDPYGDYEPSNCRWVGMKDQARNKRKMGGDAE